MANKYAGQGSDRDKQWAPPWRNRKARQRLMSRYRSCGSKRRFETEAAAQHCTRVYPQARGQRAYDCQHCGGWHLTSRSRTCASFPK